MVRGHTLMTFTKNDQFCDTPPPPPPPPPLLLLLGRGVDSLQTGAARTVCRFKRELDEKERGSVFELS